MAAKADRGALLMLFACGIAVSVAGVAIRRLLPAEAVLAGGRATVEHSADSVPWVSAEDGAGLRDLLGEAGLIDPKP